MQASKTDMNKSERRNAIKNENINIRFIFLLIEYPKWINKISKEDKFMNESFSEEIKKELVKQAVKSLDDPFKILTVKDVAKDLYMGENKTNEIFNRADFPSVNIGKTRKIQKIAYILWKMEKRIDVI